jgi:DNA polymerase-3 subunit epsilon
MQLNLKKPIIFFDLETTGTNVVNDRIVQISYIKITPDGKEVERNYFVNPGMPIPPQATAVHHITDEMVADKPLFKEIAQTVANDMEGCDFGGFNSNRFDVPLLAEEMIRAGVDFDLSKRRFIDVQNIFHKKEQRTLSAAYQFYCHKSLEDAHSADADTRATYEVLLAQLDRYPDLQNDVEFLHSYSQMNRNVDPCGYIVYNDKNIEVFNFGKHKGEPVLKVLESDLGYFSWILQGQFPLSTKKVLTGLKLAQIHRPQ